MKAIRDLLRDERGSATIEFIMIAIPLFIPLAIYLTSINAQSQSGINLHNLARQAARAYVTSPSSELALPRANTVVGIYQSQILAKASSSHPRAIIDLSVACSANPCLTPESRVTVTVTLIGSRESASDTQIVDAWSSSP